MIIQYFGEYGSRGYYDILKIKNNCSSVFWLEILLVDEPLKTCEIDRTVWLQNIFLPLSIRPFSPFFYWSISSAMLFQSSLLKLPFSWSSLFLGLSFHLNKSQMVGTVVFHHHILATKFLFCKTNAYNESVSVFG